MALPLALTVGQQSVGDGTVTPGRADKFGGIVTHEACGKHFEQTLRGNAFIYHIASQALILSATTGGHPTVINPIGSGVIFVPTKLAVSFISGTTVVSSVILAETLNVGGGAATAAPILTATLVAAKPALRGAGTTARCQWSPTTNTFTAAPTSVCATGINLGAVAPSAGSGMYETKFDGSIAFYPGTACSICATVTTTTALFQITLFGLEVPLPPGS